jgi:hypothetical protein
MSDPNQQQPEEVGDHHVPVYLLDLYVAIEADEAGMFDDPAR